MYGQNEDANHVRHLRIGATAADINVCHPRLPCGRVSNVNDWPFRNDQAKVYSQAHVVPTDVSAEMRAGRQSEYRDFAKDVRLERLVVAGELGIGKERRAAEKDWSLGWAPLASMSFLRSLALAPALFNLGSARCHSSPPAPS